MTSRNLHPLPLTIDELTAGWMTAALRVNVPDVTVRGMQIIDMKRSTCTKIRLKLELDEVGRRAGIPETVIVKGGFEPHSRYMYYVHEKESQSYRDILPVLKLPSPACYFADFDPELRQGIVIMEDLVARGVTFCDPRKPQTHAEVARRLSELARFHAQTWGSPEFKGGGRWGWVDDAVLKQRPFFDDFMKPDVWQKFVDSPRGAASSVRFHSRDWMASAMDKIEILGRQLPHAIVLGDTHLGNLYVDTDGTPGFFDFICGHEPAMMEVAYHITGALDTADRARWEGPLVQHYLDELARNGAPAPTFDEAMYQFGVFIAYGFCIFITNDSIFQSEAINTAYTARFSTAMLDHDTDGLLKGIN